MNLKRWALIASGLSLLASVRGVAQIATRQTLAVAYFDNNAGSVRYDYWRKALADMLITDLSKIKVLQLVEREKLEQVIKELKLQQEKLFDQRTAQRMGQLLGASHILTGSFTRVGTQVRFDVRVVRTSTGEIVMAEKALGTDSALFDMEKTLATAVIDGLKIDINPHERRDVEQYATTSVKAFEAFGEGLVAADRGDSTLAHQRFSAALAADPSFRAARSAAERMRQMTRDLGVSFDDQLLHLDPRAPDLVDKLSAIGPKVFLEHDKALQRSARLLAWAVKNDLNPIIDRNTSSRLQPSLFNTLMVALQGTAGFEQSFILRRLVIAGDIIARANPSDLGTQTILQSAPLLEQLAATYDSQRQQIVDHAAIAQGMPFVDQNGGNARVLMDDAVASRREPQAALGIKAIDLVADDAKLAGLKQLAGAKVSDFSTENSPARMAGLAPGDIIIRIDGREVDNVFRLQQLIGWHKPGERIEAIVVRRDKEIVVRIKLGTAVDKTDQIACDFRRASYKLSAATVDDINLLRTYQRNVQRQLAAKTNTICPLLEKEVMVEFDTRRYLLSDSEVLRPARPLEKMESDWFARTRAFKVAMPDVEEALRAIESKARGR